MRIEDEYGKLKRNSVSPMSPDYLLLISPTTHIAIYSDITKGKGFLSPSAMTTQNTKHLLQIWRSLRLCIHFTFEAGFRQKEQHAPFDSESSSLDVADAVRPSKMV